MRILKSIGPNSGIATPSSDQICDSPVARMPVPNIITVLPKSIAAGANVAANSAIRLKALLVVIVMFLFAVPAFASAPVCMYQDVQSGPATGGEGGGGVYVDVYGANFGSSLSAVTITVNGTTVTNKIYLGADNTGNRQQLGFQVPSGTTGSGNIVITTPGGSCSNMIFTVRAASIYYIGSGTDNVATGASFSCSTLKNGTAGDGLGGSGTYASPWTLTDVVSIGVNGGSSNTGPATNARTPQTYYNCISQGDVLVFLNGVNFPYFGGRLYSTLAFDNGFTSPIYTTVMARPGGSVVLGGDGYVSSGIRDYADEYMVVAGLTLTGTSNMSSAGSALAFGETAAGPDMRAVGNTIYCPDCFGSAGALAGGFEGDSSTNDEVLGNYVKGASCTAPGGLSNKQYHAIYVYGNAQEIAWNKIADVCTYNGIQINFGPDDGIGYGNFSIHDNDIEGANGAGINLATLDPAQGPINIYNNIIHHVGIQPASDSDGNHACISSPGEAPSAGSGTVNIYNNTMWDCSSDLNTSSVSNASAFLAFYETAQTGLTFNLTNNIIAQPAYTYTSEQNVFISYTGAPYPTVTGSNNLFYSASTPGSTAPALLLTSLTIQTNPLSSSSTTPGPWTNMDLQDGSPAIGAGSTSLYPRSDFAGVTRSSPPSIGALEYGSTSSVEQITVSATPNPVTLGQSVTLTATVGQTSSSVPTGSINFMNGSVSLGQASLDSQGTATLVLSSLAAGSYSVVGSYSGDSNYPAGESGVVSLQVLSTTETTLVASPNPVAAGQTLNMVATVSASGTASLSGTVNFMNGSTVLGSGSVNASGVATLSIASLPAGTYSLTAQYSGTASFVASTSAAASVTVTASTATTTTSLVASPNPVTVGQTLNLVATVSASGTASLSGTVNFMNGSTVLGSASVSSSGIATLSIASLPAGTYSLTARYMGNSNFLASTSAAASLTVTASTAATITSLAASPNPVTTGQTLNLVATVRTSGTTSLSGTVNFMNGSTVLGSGSVNASGVATLSIASLPTGTYSLTARYMGNSNYLASTSAAASLTVTAATAATITSLVASPNPVTVGQTLNMVATVSASGTASLSGTVNFMNGSTVLGSASVNSSGVATLSIASLPAGTYSLTARYMGNSNYLTSTSPASSVAVTTSAPTTTISLVALPNPVTEGQALVLTATVTESGTPSPTGTVSFMNGSAVMGTAVLNSSGVATLSITSLAVGTYSITAQYPSVAGNNPQGSGSASPASATVLVTVDAATVPIVPSFSMTVSGSTPSVLAGQTAVYSLVVTPTTGTALPAITFAASGLPAGATATFSPAMIAAGRGTTNVTLSIQTPAAQSARLERNRELNGGLPVVALCLLLLPFGRSSRRFGKRLARLSSMVLLLAGATSLMGLTGCGADVAHSIAQSYTVTVTSASASVTQTAQVTLAVE